ncbi:MAG: GAF domain-containing protein, partial [Methanospirillum sp.]
MSDAASLHDGPAPTARARAAPRMSAEEALRRSEARQALLTEVASRLLQTEEPQAVVDDLCRRALAVLDCDVFFNYLAGDASGRLLLNAYGGIPAEEAERIRWLDYGAAVCGCVARDGCRIVAEAIPEHPDPRTDLVAGYGVRAYACHPLMVEGRSIGTLSFGTTSRDRFAADELATMKAIADLIAIAMQRIADRDALREREGMLRRYTRELERSNEELQRFVTVAYHDLQEPLRPIISFSQLLARRYGGRLDADADEYIAFIVDGGMRMQALIRDLLRFSQLEAGALEPVPTETARAAAAALAPYADLLRELGGTATVGPLPPVMADPAQLEAIFSNLIENAFKYRREGVPPTIA